MSPPRAEENHLDSSLETQKWKLECGHLETFSSKAFGALVISHIFTTCCPSNSIVINC